MHRLAAVALSVVVTLPLAASPKKETWNRLVDLGRQIEALKAQGEGFDSLLGEYASLSAQLGGDDPAGLFAGGGDDPDQLVQPPGLAGRGAPAAPPGGTTTTTSFPSADTPIAIPDGPGGMAASSITVSGVDTYLFDLDLTTDITHTFAADLEIDVTSPAGTVVTLTTGNGGGNDDVFAGTLWDDDAGDTNPPGPATDNTYANLVTETPLVPEEALSAFIGEDPNGTWTLDIIDDAGMDTGTLNSWSLDVTTLPFPTIETASSFPSTDTPIAIPDGPGGMAASTIAVSGVDTYLCDVDLTTDITHTFAADLDIDVTSPAGTVVTLTTDNGESNDDVFAGTLWDDDAGDTNPPGPATDNTYANLVTETPLVPEEALGAFIGEDPNGTWTLDIIDDAVDDTGTLNSWSLDLITCLGSADLQVAKSDSVDPVVAGDLLVYTVTAENLGPADASAVTVTDTLPADVTWVSDTCGAGPPAGQTLTWNVGALASGASTPCDVTVMVSPSASGTLFNMASISGNEGDSNGANDAVTEPTQVVREADVSLTKTVDLPSDPVIVGATVNYVLTVENLGPSSATTVTVTDTLPPEVSWVSDDCAAGPPAGQLLTWNVGTLAPGAMDVCQVVVAVNDRGTMIENSASLTAAETDPTPGDNADSTSFDAAFPIDIPTVGGLGLVILSLLLVTAAFRRL